MSDAPAGAPSGALSPEDQLAWDRQLIHRTVHQAAHRHAAAHDNLADAEAATNAFLQERAVHLHVVKEGATRVALSRVEDGSLTVEYQ